MAAERCHQQRSAPGRFALLALLATLWWLTTSARLLAAAGAMEPVAGDYRYCTVCHGATGTGNLAIQAPALAGIEGWYLLSRLQAYRAGQLGRDFATDPAGTEMHTVARELSDESLSPIARYIASFPLASPMATVAGSAAIGRDLYNAQCAVCHGARGEGNELLRAPGLARLNDWYLSSAYTKYRTGLRGAPESDPYAQQMRTLAEALGPDFRINDVARYLTSLQPAAPRSMTNRSQLNP